MKYALLFLILIISVVVFKAYRALTTRKQRLEATITNRLKNEYHAIKLAPCDNCCEAALQVSQKIFLTKDIPMPPLESCDRNSDCQCRLTHYDDRRQNEERRSINAVLQSIYKGIENRKQKEWEWGRRKSDEIYTF